MEEEYLYLLVVSGKAEGFAEKGVINFLKITG